MAETPNKLKVKPTPFCFVLMGEDGSLRYPVRFPQPAERCCLPNEEVIALYTRESIDDSTPVKET